MHKSNSYLPPTERHTRNERKCAPSHKEDSFKLYFTLNTFVVTKHVITSHMCHFKKSFMVRDVRCNVKNSINFQLVL